MAAVVVVVGGNTGSYSGSVSNGSGNGEKREVGSIFSPLLFKPENSELKRNGLLHLSLQWNLQRKVTKRKTLN